MNLLCHGHSLSGLTRENRAGRFQEPARRLFGGTRSYWLSYHSLFPPAAHVTKFEARALASPLRDCGLGRFSSKPQLGSPTP